MDGEGDLQWSDIFNGERVAIPRLLSEYRVTENILRPIVANAVAYHCTKPLRFIAEARQDSRARQQAIIDGALANYIAREQRLNGIGAAAMYFAMACGFCPVHGVWRTDIGFDPYEPLYSKPEQEESGRLGKGRIDLWVGNPFDTTYNEGAKRGSVHACRYGRVVPAEQVRKHFGVQVEGTDRLPSASVFQRVARRWNHLPGLNQHGSAIMQPGQGGEELLALVCEEIAPGIEPDFPTGRLTIIAVPGAAETRRDGASRGSSQPLHLVTQALPAGRFSWVNFYTDQRYDDVHGAPWVSPLVHLQGELNQVLSDRKAYRKRAVSAPTFISGEVVEDQLEYDGYSILNVPGEAKFVPKVMDLPGQPFNAMAAEAQEYRQAMYTIGGYQSASRGEGSAGDPYAKVAFLAEQDDSVHGPANQEYRASQEQVAQLCWALFQAYGDEPWQIENVGEDFDMLGDAYLDRTRVSEQPPMYRVVSGFGATNELYARQLLQAVQLRGADGEVVLPTAEFRRKWPDGSMFDQGPDPTAAQRRRAQVVNNKLRMAADVYREQFAFETRSISDPAVQQAAAQLGQMLETVVPMLQSDDPAAHMAALTQLEQDESEDALARAVAGQRRVRYQQWQQQMAMWQAQSQQAVQQPQQQEGASKPIRGEADPVSLSEDAGVVQPAAQEDPMMAGAM